MGADPEDRQQHVLERECESAEKRLSHQANTIGKLGDNATKMFHVLLVSSAAIIAGLLQLGGSNDGLRGVVQTHECILSVVAGGFFLSIFFLVSATLGVGTAVEHTSGESECDTAQSSPETYFSQKLDCLEWKINYNERVIEGHRRMMLMADAFVSISFVALGLLGVKLYLGEIQTEIMGLIIIAVGIGGVYIDLKYPPTHPAKLLPLRNGLSTLKNIDQNTIKNIDLSADFDLDLVATIAYKIKILLVIAAIVWIAYQLPNCQSSSQLVPFL